MNILKISLLLALICSYSGFISCQNLSKSSPPIAAPPGSIDGEFVEPETIEFKSTTDRFQFLTLLPTVVNECSGMEFINGDLWTLNDGGSTASVYQISGEDDQLRHQITIQDAVNTDWEEMAVNEEYMYIGNFGNNYGMRKDLVVYMVSMEGINKDSESATIAKTIEFEFVDQTEFRHTANKHNFDCEAMIAYNDLIYLFSKNRGDNQCTIYSLDPSKSDAKQKAQAVSTFDTKGQVTGADLNEDTGVLALLGYVYKPEDRSVHPFLYLLYDFPDNNFFAGKHKHIDLGIEEQTEGITFVDANTLYIASEAESGGQGKLFQFDISGLIE